MKIPTLGLKFMANSLDEQQRDEQQKNLKGEHFEKRICPISKRKFNCCGRFSTK